MYDQPWFVTVLGLLAMNILAAAIVRFPWKMSQIGFVVTHAGLLLVWCRPKRRPSLRHPDPRRRN